jgi:histone acetyltransferase (RNA polymerase elongator complex component)
MSIVFIDYLYTHNYLCQKAELLKHYTIPIFIPQQGCPFQCVFCNQEKITSRGHAPDEEEVYKIISQHHSSFPKGNKHVEIGFFGGSFTGLKIEEQEMYLRIAQSYMEKGMIQGIRLSTRPDYISAPGLHFLKKYGVTTIELGAQSMDEEVLIESARGHTAEDVEMASRMIIAHGFRLGLQMMLGLPGDMLNKAIFTARKIIELGACETRIYPVLVIKGTKLEEWYEQGKYRPLSLDEAVFWLKTIIPLFEEAGVEVTRVGLHSSVGLHTGKELVAGPFHPSIRELAMTEVWWDRLVEISKDKRGEIFEITVNPSQYNFAIGYYGKNRKRLLKYYRDVIFKRDSAFKENEFHADHR